jgi:hypothetical protein
MPLANVFGAITSIDESELRVWNADDLELRFVVPFPDAFFNDMALGVDHIADEFVVAWKVTPDLFITRVTLSGDTTTESFPGASPLGNLREVTAHHARVTLLSAREEADVVSVPAHVLLVLSAAPIARRRSPIRHEAERPDGRSAVARAKGVDTDQEVVRVEVLVLLHFAREPFARADAD